MESAERLQKYLSRAGVASRRHAEQFILAGRVMVNGKVVYRLGEKIVPGRDKVRVDGREVLPPSHSFLYLAFYKPKGMLTTMRDPKRRLAVDSLVQSLPARVYPIGRLDRASEGLLLFTNDGDFAYRMLHPRFHVEKEYEVDIKGSMVREQLARLEQGILLDGMKRNLTVQSVRFFSQLTRVVVILYEGRKRQIRRMFQTMGKEVVKLKRIRIGPIHLGKLSPGHYRLVRKDELDQLQMA